MIIRLIVILAISLNIASNSQAKRPQVASYMKGKSSMTEKAISTLDKIAKGEIKIEHKSYISYGDGGSTGVLFDLSNSQRLTVFIPFWSARYPADIRLRISNKDDNGIPWSNTLEENLSLKRALTKTIQKLQVTDLDKATAFALKDLQKAINRKPDESINYDPADVEVPDDPFSTD
ncbi:hypothetical protein HW115_19035 [Verrucomicrobiaceae bacterium N1E253]|uniref:Uncharacterized protein n=1 Tax=Oceaniferula marina TaxID=2748318 RepID=A0A851GPA6_9BACT|nr:hypothetical protein [Oceaniferula marina]NWK57721.1 hypothetical protein [Oceaniferula marina]